MPTSPKDSDKKPEKSSFWEKLNEKQSSGTGTGSSLVDAIVKQAEKEAGYTKKHHENLPNKQPNPESSEKEKVQIMLANAKTLLGFVMFVSIGIWLYFFTMLHESNYFHKKFGKENLTVELNRKTEILQQLRTDNRDTIKFSKLLRIENLANQICSLDLTDPILNFEKPKGESVMPRDGDTTGALLKTVNANGEIIYLSELEIRSIENAHEIKVEFTRNVIAEILTEVKTLREMIKTNPEIEDQLEILSAELTAINLKEENFPSSTLKFHFDATQSVSKNILQNVKSENLKNLVTDIKKQSQAIDTSGADKNTKAIIKNLQTSLEKLSAQRPSSFDTALKKIQELDITDISENEIYQKAIRIIAGPQNTENDSDLFTAAIIARNLGRINAINDLRAAQITWTNVIDQVGKIVRLGADLERDTEGTPLDARRDIDPNGELVTLLSYSGKSKSGEITISGNVLGEAAYHQKSFTLVADLVDAFEGSKYFKDVSGFTFSKQEDRQGRTTSPLNFKLSLQNPTTTNPYDITKIKRLDVDSVILKEDNINVEALEEIDFSLSSEPVSEKIEKTSKSEGKFAAADKNLTAENDAEFVDIFEALRRILNH